MMRLWVNFIFFFTSFSKLNTKDSITKGGNNKIYFREIQLDHVTNLFLNVNVNVYSEGFRVIITALATFT